MTTLHNFTNDLTDKHTVHAYMDTYESKFAPRRFTAKRVLEIGINHGGSLRMWHDYFPNAEIYAIDILPDSQIKGLFHTDRTKIYTSTNA